MAQNTNLFPTIGDIASQTDEIVNESETKGEDSQFDNEDKVVQEIESLCMKCEEQVSILFYPVGICN
jgi:zinc finger protein